MSCCSNLTSCNKFIQHPAEGIRFPRHHLSCGNTQLTCLKEALRELSVFRFTYLGNHDTLIHDLINNPKELTNAISEIMEKFGYNKPILVEAFLRGNDLSVGIIGNPPESYMALPIVEEDMWPL